MNLYKYETHTHTSEGSKCSHINAKALVRFYKEAGFNGLIITDHFLNGNTTVSKELSWPKKIDHLCLGYEIAAQEGNKIGIDVMFGWEYSYRGSDLLTYGLSKGWLLKNQQIMTLSINDYCDYVRSEGGFLVHAHPFREADYIDMIRLFPRKVDAVEILNASRLDFENDRAEEYARNYNLLRFAGTDNHTGPTKRMCGLTLERPISNIDELITSVKTAEAKSVIF